MKEVSVLMIGVGRVGSRFYEKFRALGPKRVNLLGVCERDSGHPFLHRVEKDGVPVYPDYRKAIRELGPKVDIIFDTTNVAPVKQDIRNLLAEEKNHHTVLLPLVVSYLLWHMAAPEEDLITDHDDPGY
jgi:predicted dinucleotide-utilizing enzyme